MSLVRRAVDPALGLACIKGGRARPQEGSVSLYLHVVERGHVSTSYHH